MLTERWLRKVGGDHAALAAIVRGATDTGKNPLGQTPTP